MPDHDDLAKLVQKMDQTSKLVSDVVPPVLHAFYERCVEQGFTPAQALQLTGDYLRVILNRTKVTGA